LRIIGGKYKGRKFQPPAKNWPTRPTTDFGREGLFNILGNHFDFEEIRVLDLFGGTGSISYEFISRGCKDVTFVDKYYPCVAFAKKVSRELNLEKELTPVKKDVFKFIRDYESEPFDLIFADPPYSMSNLAQIPDFIFKAELLLPQGWLILEHDFHHTFEQHSNFFRKQKYGNNIFSFFKEG